MLVDTHCHIHESSYPLDRDEAINRAHLAGVDKMICVGIDIESSRQAVEFASSRQSVFSAIGVHPHDAKLLAGTDWQDQLRSLATAKKLVAIGEIGLDYFYEHSPRSDQIRVFEAQLQIAVDHNLPVIFHVRDGFDDFWPVVDNFTGLRGVLHSFTDNKFNLDQGLKRGFYIGVNGISTFTKDIAQQQLFASIPLDRLLLETDAPFLTPSPLRGKVNEPGYVCHVAQHQAEARQISISDIGAATSANAHVLFGL